MALKKYDPLMGAEQLVYCNNRDLTKAFDIKKFNPYRKILHNITAGIYFISIQISKIYAVPDRLSAERPVLLIDPFYGCCLSHERFFLPPIPLRGKFGFMHVPLELLAIATMVGQSVKFLSSKDKGYIIRQDFSRL